MVKAESILKKSCKITSHLDHKPGRELHLCKRNKVTCFLSAGICVGNRTLIVKMSSVQEGRAQRLSG